MNRYDAKMQYLNYSYLYEPVYLPSEEQLAAFEDEIGTELPEDYREFIKKFGFSCWRNNPWILKKGNNNLSVNWFNGLWNEAHGDLRSYFGLGLPKHVLLIAEADGSEYVYQTKGPFCGNVYNLIIHEIPEDETYDVDQEAWLIANSFDEFIHMIHAES